jgi:hypothetical protein
VVLRSLLLLQNLLMDMERVDKIRSSANISTAVVMNIGTCSFEDGSSGEMM